jgi:hypothetical protein
MQPKALQLELTRRNALPGDCAPGRMPPAPGLLMPVGVKLNDLQSSAALS